MVSLRATAWKTSERNDWNHKTPTRHSVPGFTHTIPMEAAHMDATHATADSLTTIGHQLTRIADILNETAPLEITQETALNAWGMRIYEQEFLDALERLGITIS